MAAAGIYRQQGLQATGVLMMRASTSLEDWLCAVLTCSKSGRCQIGRHTEFCYFTGDPLIRDRAREDNFLRRVTNVGWLSVPERMSKTLDIKNSCIEITSAYVVQCAAALILLRRLPLQRHGLMPWLTYAVPCPLAPPLFGPGQSHRDPAH
jgi:hypothetical protein